MGNFTKGFLTALEIVGESIVTASKYDKETSIARVNRYTTYSIAEHYRALINDLGRMTEKEKQLVFNELAIQFGQEDRLKEAEREVAVTSNSNNKEFKDEWTKEEMAAFDRGYQMYTKSVYGDLTEGELARNIKSSWSRLGNKTLMQVVEKVREYKQAGI